MTYRGKEALASGFMALIAGLTASLVIPSSNSLIYIFSSSFGAAIPAVFRKKKKTELGANDSQNFISVVKELERQVIANQEQISTIKQKALVLLDTDSQQPKQASQKIPSPIKKSAVLETLAVPRKIKKPIKQKIKLPASNIETWFEDKGITLLLNHAGEYRNKRLEQASALIAENYSLIQTFYTAIRRVDLRYQSIEIDLQEESEESLRATKKVFSFLLDNFFLKGSFSDSEKKIRLNTVIEKSANNLFAGTWLKMFIYRATCDFLDNKNIPYASIWDPTTPKGEKKAHLDMLFWVQDNLLWIPCKSTKSDTGTLENHVDLMKLINCPSNRQILVLAEPSLASTVEKPEVKEVLDTLPIAGTENFLAVLSDLLRQKYQ